MKFQGLGADPSLLNRFSVLSFPNLKSYKFLYWFCFASLAASAASMPPFGFVASSSP